MDQPTPPALSIRVEATFHADGSVVLEFWESGTYLASVKVESEQGLTDAIEAFTLALNVAGRNSVRLQKWRSTLRTYLQELAAWHVEQAMEAQLAQRKVPAP